MTQRAIEVIVGKLITDEAFRRSFARRPRCTLEELVAQGVALTETEIRALVETRADLWSEVGDQIDPALQKASLKPE